MATRTARWRTKSDERMSLGAHLVELRKRLTIAAAAIAITAIGGFIASDYVIAALQAPIMQVAETTGRDANLNFDMVTGAFDIKLQIALTIAVVAASPIWLYQIWAFLVPGLVRKEKQYALGFLGAAVPLFLLGCFAGYMVMPHIVELMLGFAPAETISNLGAKYYYDFILKLLLATGIAFVLPVFLVLLNFVGVLSGKALLKGWRVAILAICLFTAIATPAADVISMFLLAIPMVVLYFAAVLIAFVHDRQVAKRNAEIEASLID